MTFALASSDAYPYVCGVYTCRCGRRAKRHGELAAVLPDGWVEQPQAGEDGKHVCPVCAEAAGLVRHSG